MAARHGGKLASELAGIQCPTAALDFDLACTIRLNAWDMERDKTKAKLIAYEVSKMFGDGQNDDESGGDDPYTDAATEVW